MSISIKTAELVLKGAMEKAMQIGVPMNVAVMDEAGHLKAFVRMDGALLGSIDIAIKKAKSAVLFGLNTEELFEYCRPGGTSFGLENTNGGLIVFAGGIPLHNANDELIGAIGVSGGAVQQDFSVAEAGAAIFNSLSATQSS
jgi:uncharacterized protein GlcG (DUF336 family)